MIIIDNLLEKRQEEGKPFKVAMIGTGFIGRGVALQILNNVPGIDIVAISNRRIEGAINAYKGAGIDDVKTISTVSELEDCIKKEQYAVTDDAMNLCKAEGVEAIIELTGAVEFGAEVITTALKNKKHVITMNAELDATVGPILRVLADREGVVYTISDGDQPGVTMNLYRFVKGIAVNPVLCGNIKGLQDRYRNPTTQEGFAKKWGQTPSMVTSFADGTKISFEQAIIANATGMQVGIRGMYGPTVEPGTPINETISLYPLDKHADGPGIVDYIVGAEPGPGVFIIGTQDHPAQKHYLDYYKLGTGPYYCFYRPYHLSHLELANSVARVLLFKDRTICAKDKPYVEVITAAKTDLKEGETLDGIGFYKTYGLCENSNIASAQNLLPMGLSEGCVLKNNISKDQVITYDDIILPTSRFLDTLRQEQDNYFT